MNDQEVTAEKKAKELVTWCAENGLFTSEPAEAAAHTIEHIEHTQLYHQEENIRNTLYQKGVTFIGYSENPQKVFIYTARKPTKAQAKNIGTAFEGSDIELECRQAGFASVKGTPAVPYAIEPCENYKGRYTCGSSIHVANPIGAGTLGCLVTDGNDIFGLTNNHVSGMCSFAEENLPIIAPGSFDIKPDSIDPFTIGHHHAVLPMADGLPYNVDVDQNTDAALFKIRDDSLVTSMQRQHYDTPAVCATLQTGMQVEKVGRTTGLTSGLVEAVAVAPIPINYNFPASRLIYFNNCFVVRSQVPGQVFATSGDSGSLVTAVNQNGERFAVGIVVGESQRDQIAYVLPLVPILGRFGVTLVCGHNT